VPETISPFSAFFRSSLTSPFLLLSTPVYLIGSPGSHVCDSQRALRWHLCLECYKDRQLGSSARGVCIRFLPSDLFGRFSSTLFLRSGIKHHPTTPSFPLTSGEKIYSVMQLFAILLLTANIAVSALAAPIANTTCNVTSSSCGPSAPDFLCGTQVGQGGFINHSIPQVTFDSDESSVVLLGTWYTPGLGACGFTNSSSQLIAAVSEKLYDNYP
jgi:hypothetical protein